MYLVYVCVHPIVLPKHMHAYIVYVSLSHEEDTCLTPCSLLLWCTWW